MPNTTQIEWLNQNSLRSYPIRENATRRATNDVDLGNDPFVLPNYIIVDFVMSISSELSNEIYLSGLTYANNELILTIGGELGIVASVTIDVRSHRQNTPYQFVGVNEYAGSKGCIVVGDLSSIDDDVPDGVYAFEKAETLFEQRCVRPSIRNIASLSIYDSTTGYRSKKLRGDIKLIAGRNVSLKYDAEKNALWISADSNAGYNDMCDCGTDTTVKTLNGLSVENIVLEGDECIDVTTSDGVIKISDKCSKPCCGCAELDFINDKIALLNSSVMQLNSFAGTIDRRITELRAYYDMAELGQDDPDETEDENKSAESDDSGEEQGQ